MNDVQNAEATEQTADTMANIANSIQTQTDDAGQQAQTSDNVGDFKNFVQENARTTESLISKVDQLSKAHEDLVNSQHREAVAKEVQSAAEKINEAVGGDKEMAQLYLEKQYKSDANLKKVWDARHENPEALDKALEVLGNEWKAKNQNIVDPQVAENQRALQDSQKSGGTVQQEDVDTKLNNMSDGEFMREMRRMSS